MKTKLEKRIIEMCWWQQVAIHDYVKVERRHSAITEISDYEAWRKCFYCNNQTASKCKDYLTKKGGE